MERCLRNYSQDMLACLVRRTCLQNCSQDMLAGFVRRTCCRTAAKCVLHLALFTYPAILYFFLLFVHSSFPSFVSFPLFFRSVLSLCSSRLLENILEYSRTSSNIIIILVGFWGFG